MRKNIAEIFFIILLLPFIQGFSQNARFDSLINKGVYQIYNIQFEKAEKTFGQLRNNYPDHPAGRFFEAMILWWKIRIDFSEESYDEILIAKLDSTIAYCDSLLEINSKNPDAIFFKGGSLGFRGWLAAVRKDWLDAALDGKDAMPLVHRAYELDSTNADVQLGFGIYNYYAEVIPEEYPFIKPFMIFFPGGDRVKGLNQLKYAAEKGRYANIESKYFMAQLYYRYEKNYRMTEYYCKELIRDFPDNPRFNSFLGRTYIKMNNYPKAARIFTKVLKKASEGKPGFIPKYQREAHYYIAYNHKKRHEFDKAWIAFEKCIELCKILDTEDQTGFWVNSVLCLGELSDLKGKREDAIKYYEEVLEMDEFGQSHELAERYIEKPYK